MVEEFMVCVDTLIASACFHPGSASGLAPIAPPTGSAASGSGTEGGFQEQRGLEWGRGDEGCPSNKACSNKSSGGIGKKEEGETAGEAIECRICHEDGEEDDMEAPCSCNGTLKFAHRKCIQKWCHKKGDIICEICNQIYAPNYFVPVRSNSDGLSIDIRQSWSQQIHLHDPHFGDITSAQQELLQAEYEDYATAHNNGIACCRSVAFILMILILFRHAVMVTRDSAMVEDASVFFNVSVLQLAGVLLPCYVIVRSFHIIQSRRRRQAYFR